MRGTILSFSGSAIPSPSLEPYVGYSKSVLDRSGVRTWLADVANVRSGRSCTEMCK